MQESSQPIGGKELRPQARTTNLIVRELPDEELVYDLKTHQAYCLNQTAAAVWNHCNGETTVPDIARALSRELGKEIHEELIWLTLRQLNRSSLLEPDVDFSTTPKRMSRRTVIEKMGRGVAFPVVVSLIAPLAVQAMTCTPTNQPCDIFANTCCTGCCNATPNPDRCSPAGGPGLALPGTPCTTGTPCCSNVCDNGRCL